MLTSIGEQSGESGVSSGEEKEVYDEKDLQKGEVLSIRLMKVTG